MISSHVLHVDIALEAERQRAISLKAECRLGILDKETQRELGIRKRRVVPLLSLLPALCFFEIF